MGLQGSVDFVIRATDLTSKPTQDIVSALQRLDQAQREASGSADGITQSTSHLKEQQQALLQIVAELDKRLADVSKYEKNKESIESLNKVLADAKTKYADLTQAFFTAQESGSKTAVTTAAENLKATNVLITQTQRQLDALNRQQDKLQQRAATRGGVDLSQGNTARAATETARTSAGTALELNQQLQAYLAEQAAEEAAARQAEKVKQAALQETADFEAKLEAARQANQRNDYATMYLRLLEEQDAELAKIAQQEKEASTSAAERAKQEQVAADALARFQQIGARANTALDVASQSRANPSAAAPSTSASSGVQAAINPLKDQVSTLSGVETALTQVEAKIKSVASSSESSAKKIEDLKNAETELNAISKSLGSQAGFIDKLNTQNTAVALAKTRLTEAEAEVRKYATAIQTATTADESLVVALQQAQGRLQGAKTSFDNQNATLERMRVEAQAAGVTVDNLAQQEARLVSAAQRAAQSQRTVGDALEQSGKSGNVFADFLDTFESKGRTTLSFTQRLRGEILSLTAAYVGVQGVIRGFGATLDAVNTTQQVKAQIAQTTDSPQEAESQFKFLVSEANRTAFSIETVAKAYTTVVRQAKEFGLSQATINKLFADALTVGRSYNQSEEQIQGTMVALGQIFDKTTIQAQEFKQQLSNSGLAGLFPTLAKVMQEQGVKSIADLRKAMEAGTISAANLVPLFDKLAQGGDKAFAVGMNSWSAQVGRFKTQLFTLENQFADSGFLEGVSQGLDNVSERLKDPETQAAVKELGQDIGKLIEFFADLVTNADFLEGALTALEIYLTGKFILSITTTSLELAALAGRMEAAGGAAAAMSGAVGTAASGGLLTACIALGVAFGLLLDKIPGVTNELDRIDNANFWKTLQDRTNRLGIFAGALTAVEKAVAFLPETLGEGIAQAQYGNEEEANKKLIEQNTATTAALRKINQERKQIMDLGEKASADDLARLKELNAQVQQYLLPQSAKKTGGDSSASSNAASDSANLEAERIARNQTIQATEDDAKKIHDTARQKELKSQKDFLDAYNQQYAAKIKQAALDVENAKKAVAADGSKENMAALAAAQQAQTDLTNAIKERADVDYEKAAQASSQRVLEHKAAAEKKAAELHEQAKDLELAQTKQIDALIQKADDDNLQARLKVVDDEIKQVNQKYEEQIRKNNEAIASSKKVGLDTSTLEADNATIRSLQARLPEEQKIAEQLATQKYNLDQQDKAEQAIQAKLKLRSALLDAIAAQQKAGLLSQPEAFAKTKEVNDATLKGPHGIDADIDAQVASLTKLIDAETAAGRGSDAATQKLEILRAELIKLKAATDASAASMDPLAKNIGEAFGQATISSVDSFVTELAKAAAGAESVGSAWVNLRDTVRNSVADMLVSIAEYIIKMQIVAALQRASNSSGGGMWGQIFSAAANAIGGSGGGSSAHTGTIVGAGGLGGATPRNVNPMWFVGAPRFHTGGFPGLKPDEYPIIAQKGEEILDKNNPRNALNGGRDIGQVGAPGGDTNIHMHADAGSFFSAGLNTKTGQRDFFVFFEANKSRFTKLLNK